LPELLSEKRREATLAGCLCVFTALVVIATCRYLKHLLEIKRRQWDLETITASDYTVELIFTEAQVMRWK
jgi:hypothetical protein